MELMNLLDKLKLEHLEAQLEVVCQQAAEKDLDYKAYLTQALATEWQGRFQRGIEARLRLARFPWLKTLDQFDFDFQPSLNRRQVRELAGLSFAERAHNVIVLGPPGVGKTHLAIALGVKAVEAGYSVLFLTLESLMTRLTKAVNENRLECSFFWTSAKAKRGGQRNAADLGWFSALAPVAGPALELLSSRARSSEPATRLVHLEMTQQGIRFGLLVREENVKEFGKEVTEHLW